MRDNFDDDNDILKARVAFFTGLLLVFVLILVGVVLVKKGVFHKETSEETTKVVVEWNDDGQLTQTSDTDTNGSDEADKNLQETIQEETATEETSETGNESNNSELNAENDSIVTTEKKEEATTEELRSDPEINMQEEVGTTSEVAVILKSNDVTENASWSLGVDVSKYQGTINWSKVANAGIHFAMVRIGYRSLDNGLIVEDANAKYNLQEATANGIKTGAYFFSTAVSEAEAIEEANFVINLISKYKITYPVAYNCEGFETPGNRQYGMSVAQRTACAKAFLNTIYNAGYTPMFYASKGEMENNRLWETSSLEKSYKVWVSWYPTVTFPDISAPNYSGSYAMWQYTNQGIVDGISKACDINIAYFAYDQTANAHDESAPPEKVEANVEATMTFKPVSEVVTAKDKTNLRDKPSQGDDSTVVYTLKNGEYVIKTGSSPSGWCKIEIDGKTYYAVERFLTAANPDAATTGASNEQQENTDGLKTVFQTCDDYVTPKIEVNLRTIPSVTNTDSQVVANVKNGETLHRIGINNDVGWSKVEYNGMVLYCVSSYLTDITQ